MTSRDRVVGRRPGRAPARGGSTFVVLGLLFALPAFVDLGSARVFEEPKALLLRAGAIIVLALAAADGFRQWRDRAIWRHPITLALLALTLAAVISSTFSILPRVSWLGAYSRQHGTLTWLALLVMYLAIAFAARVERTRGWIVAVAISGSVAPAVYALAQAAGRDPIEWSWVLPGRAGSTFGNPILLGGYLAAVIPLTAAAALSSLLNVAHRFSVASAGRSAALKRRATKPSHIAAKPLDVKRGSALAVYAAILALQLAALLATRSRGPLLGLLAAGALALALAAAMLPRRRALLLGGVLAAALALGVVGLLGPGRALAARVFDTSEGSGRVRMLIWQGSLEAVRADPRRMVIGHGPETFRAVYLQHYAPALARAEQSDALPDRAHNDTLDALVTTGIAGTTATLIFYACILATGLALVWRTRAASEIEAYDSGGRRLLAGDAVLAIGLLALAAAHVVEIQLGIATVASRLQLLVAAALLVSLASQLKLAPTTLGGGLELAPTTLGGGLKLAPTTLGGGLKLAPATLDGTPLRGRSASDVGAGFSRLDGDRAAKSPAWRMALALAIAAVAIHVVALRPAQADWRAREARDLERQRRFQEAAAKYREASALAPGVDDYLTGLARSLSVDDAFAGAADALHRASVLAPLEVDHPRNLGRLYRAWAVKTPDDVERARHLESVDAAYTKATTLAPAMPSTWIEWATSDFEQQRLASAASKLDRAAALDDQVPMLWLVRGHVRARHNDLPGAFAAFDRATVLDPGFVLALRARAGILILLDRRKEALDAMDALEARSPGDSALDAFRNQLRARER